MSQIGSAVLQICSHLGIGHAQVAAGHAWGKNEFFFGNVPNGSIRKVNWLKSKFEHLLQNLSTTGGFKVPVLEVVIFTLLIFSFGCLGLLFYLNFFLLLIEVVL